MQDRTVLWISHRGYHIDSIENTLRSFDAAIAAGFTHLETDLRCTSDGQIVLNHDPDLQKSCGLSQLIGQSSWKQLQNIQTKDGQRLLDLDAFMERYAGFNWTFDIKAETAGPVLFALAQWARSRNAESWLNEQARFLCWGRKAEKFLHQLLPRVKTLARETECYRAGLSVFAQLPWVGGIQSGRIYALPRFFAGRDLFTLCVADAYHKRGAKLLAYLPNGEADTKAALAAGFDEVLTNFLPLKMAGLG